MDEQAVGDQADAFGAALIAGDIDRAIGMLSNELRRNVGEVLALLPLPARDATIESIEHGASSFTVRLAITGETEEAVIQTRWKERDGRPVMIEASHLSRSEIAQAADTDAADAVAVESGADPTSA
jgi:hypothetical protein